MIENNEATKFKENQILIHDFNQTSVEKQFSIKGLNLSKSFKSRNFIFFFSNKSSCFRQSKYQY